MEKKISMTRNDIIKWVTFLAMILSAYFSLLYRVNNLKDENDGIKQENIEIKRELRDLKEQVNETGKEVSMINGKLDEINGTVKSIADAIYSSQFGKRN